MASTDKRIDAYIARSAPFARPVLTSLRKLVHRACPGAVETIKWGFPHFEHHGILCSMAAFKRHCAFGFWKARLLKDPAGALASSGEAMGQLGKITGKNDLPSDAILVRLIRQAARLNERGVHHPRAAPTKDVARPTVPPAFKAALRQDPAAASTFRRLSPSRQREYIEWISEAKRPETRKKRTTTAIEWLSRGRTRDWKYKTGRKSGKP